MFKKKIVLGLITFNILNIMVKNKRKIKQDERSFENVLFK